MYTKLSKINNFTGRDPFGSHKSKQMFVYSLQTKYKGCELALEEPHYHLILVPQYCGFILVKLVFSLVILTIILILLLVNNNNNNNIS
jgi:hypothetical protein